MASAEAKPLPASEASKCAKHINKYNLLIYYFAAASLRARKDLRIFILFPEQNKNWITQMFPFLAWRLGALTSSYCRGEASARRGTSR